jgi:hypothetical protein
MRTRVLLHVLLAAATIIAFSTGIGMAAQQDFTVHNHSGKTIKNLYVSPTSSDHWGDDILGEDTLDDGDSFDVKFDRDQDECTYDIKVKFEDGSDAEDHDVDLCSTTDVNF